MYIKEIAKLQAGYTFRTALKPEENGKNLVIQAKDIRERLYVDDGKLTQINHQLFKTNALIRNNDIIVSVRGRVRAAVYNGNLNNIIASSSVYILRLIHKNIIPEYLTIYLNSNASQKEINRSLIGGVIKTILRKNLENIKVVIPNIEEQQTIINLYKNNIAVQDKLDLKKNLISNISERAINKILTNAEIPTFYQ